MKQLKICIIFIFLPLSLITGCGSSAAINETNLTTYNITISGLKNEYRFLYLTDSHIIIPDKNSDTLVQDYAAQRLPVFENDENIVSKIPLSEWVHYANSNSLDGLLLGGDTIDSPAPSNIKYLDSCLSDLKIPYVYTLGNHDWTYPWNYMTEAGKNEYLPLLSPYMNQNPVIHTQKYEGLTVVSIDNSSNQIHPQALEEYKAILAKNTPVILMLHVPLYTESIMEKSKLSWKHSVILGGGIHGGTYPDAVSTEFLRLTTAKDSPVAVILAGHVHFEDYSTVIGEKNILQITGDAAYKGKGTLIKLSGE